MTEVMTNIILPKGEWLDSIVAAFAKINMPIISEEPSDRCYSYNFIDQGLIPITFTLARSRNVLKLLNMEKVTANAGFTGSDIVEEQGGNNLAYWNFELVSQLMKPTPFLYLGSTPNLRRQIPNPSIADIAGSIIYTTYPRITEKYLERQGLQATVESMDGGIEGLWKPTPTNLAVVDIGQTLKTARQNGIEVMDDNVMRPEISFVQSEMISPQDRRRCEYLQALIWQRSRKYL